MKNKVTSSLVAIVIAASLGSGNISCVNPDPFKPDAVQRREQLVVENVQDIMDSVYQVRVNARYRIVGAPDTVEPDVLGMYGTAVAVRKSCGNTYLLTNAHVVTPPPVMIEDEPSGINIEDFIFGESNSSDPSTNEIIFNLATVFGIRELIDYEIIIVEKPELNVLQPLSAMSSADVQGSAAEVVRTGPGDMALISTSENLYVSNAYVVDSSVSARVGEDVYAVSYPGYTIPILTKGVVSNSAFLSDTDEHVDVLNISMSSGGSGGAYFFTRGNLFYLGGLINAVLPYEGTGATFLSLGLPISSFEQLLTGSVQDETCD